MIFNAFSITVAQRTKETATLRAIGSSRRQVMRMIVAEAVVLGVIASAIGTALGIGLARGLAALFDSFGVELPGGSTVVESRSVVVAMVAGIVVTVLAAYLPARRASKVPPIAALRDVDVDTSGGSRRRAVIGTVLTGLGAALVVAGTSGDVPPVRSAAVSCSCSPVWSCSARSWPRASCALPAHPWPRCAATTGALARDNAVRNPKRTAATASALTIGVALVVLMTVFAASVRSSIDQNVDTNLRSDWVIAPLQQDGLSRTVAQQVDALPETASVTTHPNRAGHHRRRDRAGHGH